MGNYLTFTVGGETLPHRTLVNPPSLRRGVNVKNIILSKVTRRGIKWLST